MIHASGFIEHVVELLAPLGHVSVRRMFGGHGLYCDGVFVGIVHDDTLYLKADAGSRAEFERAGCEIFSYKRKGKVATLNFYRAPGDAMDSPQRMLPWARKALEAALRARATPRSRQNLKRKTAARGSRRHD
ncbi:MAG TPA: TfoX/Sxy family protein [Burkholderiales bacterium]